MFKYVYEISPIDFMGGTITVREYMNSLTKEIESCCDSILDDGVNLLETKNSGSDHIFIRLEKAGQAVEYICNFFEEHGEEFMDDTPGLIRVFSVPVDCECKVSYFAKAVNNGTTYVFSDLYFPFLNRNSTNIKKYE